MKPRSESGERSGRTSGRLPRVGLGADGRSEDRHALPLSLGYDTFIPMVHRKAKIAFSIDARLLASVERVRAHTGESRSAVIARAIARLTSDNEQQERVRRYVLAYQEQPEDRRQVEAARRHARHVLAGLPWEDK